MKYSMSRKSIELKKKNRKLEKLIKKIDNLKSTRNSIRTDGSERSRSEGARNILLNL